MDFRKSSFVAKRKKASADGEAGHYVQGRFWATTFMCRTQKCEKTSANATFFSVVDKYLMQRPQKRDSA